MTKEKKRIFAQGNTYTWIYEEIHNDFGVANDNDSMGATVFKCAYIFFARRFSIKCHFQHGANSRSIDVVLIMEWIELL